MSDPLVSICIPAYKALRYLPETLASIRAQTFENWELIVVEDGSDDGTAQLVQTFATTVAQPVRYLRHERNQGLPATRNTGFAAANSPWIAILDADDLWTPDHLASLLATQEKTGAGLVFASSQIFDSDTGLAGELRDATADQVATASASLFRGVFVIQPSSVLFARELVNRHGGFDAAFPICNDLEYWLRLATAGIRFAHTGLPSCLYRKHAGAMSMQSARLIAEVGSLRRAYAGRVQLPVAEKRAVTAQAFWNAARMARRTEPRRAARWAWQAVRARFFA